MSRSTSADPPPQLTTSTPGSFAHYTILNRLPAIVDRVLADHDYPADLRSALEALHAEVAEGRPVEPLREDTADQPEWDTRWQEYAGHTWLDIPWYFAEAYFYRRLLEAAGYFRLGPWQGIDPFGPQKERELDGPALRELAAALQRLSPAPADRMAGLLLFTLWGNRADLTFASMAQTAYAGLQRAETSGLLIDDRPRVWRAMAGGVENIAFLNDNVGLELLMDLALADHLLRSGLAGHVRFHLKSQPFFVSDASIADVEKSIPRLIEHPELHELGRRLDGARTAGRMALTDAPFWSSADGFEALPPALYEELSAADLVIVKGDANYRRLLDDRAWPHDASLVELTAYFPADYVAIRALKSEVVVGLTNEVVEGLEATEPEWRVSGQYGVIHYVAQTNPPAT